MGEEGNGELLFNGYRVSVLQDGKSSGDVDDGCTTMWTYLMPLNCTFKMDKMVIFMLCVFYHNKKYWGKKREEG